MLFIRKAFFILMASRYSDWLLAGLPGSRGSSPVRTRIFISPWRPDRLWNPPTLPNLVLVIVKVVAFFFSEGIALKCEKKESETKLPILQYRLQIHFQAERSGRMVRTSALYSESFGFKYPEDRLSCWGFSHTLRVCTGRVGTTTDSGKDRYLPCHFQFVFTNHPAIRCCTVWADSALT